MIQIPFQVAIHDVMPIKFSQNDFRWIQWIVTKSKRNMAGADPLARHSSQLENSSHHLRISNQNSRV